MACKMNVAGMSDLELVGLIGLMLTNPFYPPINCRKAIKLEHAKRVAQDVGLLPDNNIKFDGNIAGAQKEALMTEGEFKLLKLRLAASKKAKDDIERKSSQCNCN